MLSHAGVNGCGGRADDKGVTPAPEVRRRLILGALAGCLLALVAYLGYRSTRPSMYVTCGCGGTAALSNLQTALTGADAYYADGKDTYRGVNGPVSAAASIGTSDLSELDTGLIYVGATHPSTVSRVISVAVRDAGHAIVMTSWAPGQKDCWGILDIRHVLPVRRMLQGQRRAAVYFFVARRATASSCAAAVVVASSISTTAFPAP